MKDPAVLFYFQDFLVGTEFMNDDEVGKYIRILCHQADKGALTKHQLERICSGKVPEAIMEKLKANGDGKYYQERMRIEKEKRESYSESRRKNRVKKVDKICKSYDIHMENENINEDLNINKDTDEKKKKTKYADFVSMTEEEYKKLTELHGDKNTRILIEILDNYKGANGKKYKNDYRAILNWVIDRAKQSGRYERKPVMP